MMKIVKHFNKTTKECNAVIKQTKQRTKLRPSKLWKSMKDSKSGVALGGANEGYSPPSGYASPPSKGEKHLFGELFHL